MSSQHRSDAPLVSTNFSSTRTAYHYDYGCERVTDALAEKDMDFVEWHDLTPCEYCAGADIDVWVAEHYHTDPECQQLADASPAKTTLDKTDAKPCQTCTGGWDEESWTCPKCNEERTGSMAAHLTDCGGESDE